MARGIVASIGKDSRVHRVSIASAKRRVTDPAELRELNQTLAQALALYLKQFDATLSGSPELARYLASLQPPPARPARPALRKNHTMEIIGTVKFFDERRGFGFITPIGVDVEDRTKQVFVHVGAVRRSGLTSLSAGQRVALELQPARKPGMKDEATALRILLDEAA
jgi:cold shock protein